MASRVQQAAARIVGAGMTALKSGRGQQQADAVQLMVDALAAAVADAGMQMSELDTVIALPSLMSDQHFMMAHAVAQAANLMPRKGMLLYTLDVGGAGPVAALLAAKRKIEHQGRRAVAIVAGDTVASAPLAEFLARADSSCSMRWSHSGQQDHLNHDHLNDTQQQQGASTSSSQGRHHAGQAGAAADNGAVPSPVIPNLYDRIARWHMQQYGTTREQLAMCASLMTYQASRHPAALHKRPRLLKEVLSSEPVVAPVTTKLECAKLADGAAALVLVPADASAAQASSRRAVAVLGGGEASGPLMPPQQLSEECFSAHEAAAAAYTTAGLTPQDINYWGLYDCFPICLIRAIEAVGLAPNGGSYIQEQYQRLLGPLEQQQQQQQQLAPHVPAGAQPWPVNTHGGLLGFGAPWEVPAMHSLIEAVAQLRGEAVGRQVAGAERALVYGNGGIFSASAVAILQASPLYSKL